MAPSNINYAKFIGYDSAAAAGVFAALYAPLFGWFAFQSLRHPTYVHLVLAFFCTLRVVAFIIRAVLAGVESGGENLGLLIADQVLFGVGYFGLLYSAYTLVLDRESLSSRPQGRSVILRLTQNRHLFRLCLSAAVTLGIAGTSMGQGASPGASSISTANTLRKVSVIIFLVLTVLQTFQTLVLARLETRREPREKQANSSFGRTHDIFILLVISALLLVRESFATATVGKITKQNNERLWYPLLALPEILAVLLFAIPGLVPPRSELLAAQS